MGEASRNLEARRVEFLKLVEEWIKPPTSDEIRGLSQITEFLGYHGTYAQEQG